MSDASTYTENRTLDFWLKANSQSTSAPGTVYLALFTGSADSAGQAAATVTNLEEGVLTDEVSTAGTAYARQSVGFGTISNGTVATSGTVTFPTATADFGTVSHVAIMDGNTAGAGNVIFYGDLTSAKLIESGDTFQITAGSLTITLA
tara:strand:- start:871 stop:1314 length:444 start_codon:yes stop_codon:yes gene_type:complete